ncbi:hypothetical protein TRFO_27678 [Tritrichomonas foetus]|uniref:Uncharacterized protein n=1 Tax=Tritrichomonas foetus TaxID=1144522 RepID=A0A1J4K519_9EUKA|nr:hypothetical protein TRFO_27678 [Tritrichomonas foetus]|eukprot:OHT04812.1 hypothetical protein TRFO_27678 [Tritrichomonas foetus]
MIDIDEIEFDEINDPNVHSPPQSLCRRSPQHYNFNQFDHFHHDLNHDSNDDKIENINMGDQFADDEYYPSPQNSNSSMQNSIASLSAFQKDLNPFQNQHINSLKRKNNTWIDSISNTNNFLNLPFRNISKYNDRKYLNSFIQNHTKNDYSSPSSVENTDKSSLNTKIRSNFQNFKNTNLVQNTTNFQENEELEFQVNSFPSAQQEDNLNDEINDEDLFLSEENITEDISDSESFLNEGFPNFNRQFHNFQSNSQNGLFNREEDIENDGMSQFFEAKKIIFEFLFEATQMLTEWQSRTTRMMRARVISSNIEVVEAETECFVCASSFSVSDVNHSGDHFVVGEPVHAYMYEGDVYLLSPCISNKC